MSHKTHQRLLIGAALIMIVAIVIVFALSTFPINWKSIDQYKRVVNYGCTAIILSFAQFLLLLGFEPKIK
jgi:hypothetical protein